MSQSDLSYQTNQPKPNSDDIIAQLQQRIESQEYQLKEQARLIQTLEDRVVSAEFKASKAMLSNEQLSQLKKELLDFIADQLEHHRPASTTPDAKVTTQLESYRQTLNDLTRQLEKTQRYEEQIKLARTDFERLHKDVSWFKGELETLNQQVREKNQRLTFFEEQRRIDFQRLTELQSELPNLQKKIEANLFARIHVLEHQIPQFGEYELAPKRCGKRCCGIAKIWNIRLPNGSGSSKIGKNIPKIMNSRCENMSLNWINMPTSIRPINAF